MVCRPCISSMSLGRAWVHDLPSKFDEAAKYGFEGIEVFYEDLEYLAKSYPGGANYHNRLAAARSVRHMCAERGLTIINLQPFMHYEGLRDRQKKEERLEELKVWFDLAQALGTDLIQVPASFLPSEQITGDLAVIVQDLQDMADLGTKYDPPFRFVYESLCWSTYIDTWEKCWDVVERVDRPNFGICLDSYNIAGKVYADPTSPSGKTPNAEADMKASIERLVKTVNVNKVFFIQIVDAERLATPLVEGHEFYVAGQPARMSWSRNCRLFYGEEKRGGYLPIKEMTDALIHGLGFDGWVSAELFNRSMADPNPSVPEEHARRGIASWHKLVKDLGIQTTPSLPARTLAGSSQETSSQRPPMHQPVLQQVQLAASEARMISVL